MISVLLPDSTKCGTMIPDWPELNPRPLLDPDRSWQHAYQTNEADKVPVASAAVPEVGLLPEHMPSVYFGEKIPDSLRFAIPRTVRLRPQPGKKWPVGRLKDFNKLNLVPIVSARAIELIETLAPGRNQFFPIDFVRADSGAPLFEGERYYLLNVCDTIRADRLFPLEAFERNLLKGMYDHFDDGVYDRGFKSRKVEYRIDRPLPGGGTQVVWSADSIRFRIPGKQNRFLVDHAAANGVPIFVVANHCDRRDGYMNLYGGAYGYLFVTEKFRDAAKKAKLTGAGYEDCISLSDL